MKSNNGILTEKDIQKRTKFWNKRQFRTWTKKELEKTSKDMQNLLVALKEFSMGEIEAIRKLDVYSFRAYGKNDPKCIVCMASQKDLDYAISIAPKTFKVKQG
ncbi:hypothetical protein C21880S2P_00021 [Bacteroides phage C2_18_80S2P]|nr:hypothetical protein C21880S2P_00021 [Bacteroides phage C2_18_80S2P]